MEQVASLETLPSTNNLEPVEVFQDPSAAIPLHGQLQPQQQQQQQDPALEVRKRRRARWEAENETRRRWDLQKRLADISADVDFLTNQVHLLKKQSDLPLPPVSALPEEDKRALDITHAQRLAEIVTHCRKALQAIITHKWSWPFLHPVDTAVYKDYLETVKTPMDFTLIRKKIDNGDYAAPEDFLTDMNLVFENARVYNKPGSDVHVMASTLQEKFMEKFVAIVMPRIMAAEEAAKRDVEAARVRLAEKTAGGTIGGGGGGGGGTGAARTSPQQQQQQQQQQQRATSRKELLEQQCSLLIKYIDEVSLCISDAKSTSALLCKPLDRKEKEELVDMLQQATQEQFNRAIGIVMKAYSGLYPLNDNLAFDLGLLDALTLRQLQSYLKTCLQEKKKREEGEGEEKKEGVGEDGGGGETTATDLAAAAADDEDDDDNTNTNTNTCSKTEPVIVWPGLPMGSGNRAVQKPSTGTSKKKKE